jgi:hypothetical protein
MNGLPNRAKPCSNCPFRKDSLKGWLGKERATELVNNYSHTCHKANDKLQCAGHMLLLKDDNTFYQLAKRMNLLYVKGGDLIFETKEDCIKHHSYV